MQGYTSFASRIRRPDMPSPQTAELEAFLQEQQAAGAGALAAFILERSSRRRWWYLAVAAPMAFATRARLTSRCGTGKHAIARAEYLPRMDVTQLNYPVVTGIEVHAVA